MLVVWQATGMLRHCSRKPNENAVAQPTGFRHAGRWVVEATQVVGGGWWKRRVESGQVTGRSGTMAINVANNSTATIRAA